MISIRGMVISLVVHSVAAALVSVSAAIHAEAPAEDVPAIPVELVLEMESAPVTPSTPVEQAVETPVQEAPTTSEPDIKPEPLMQTASLPHPKEPELATKQEAPLQIPKVEEPKPKPSEQPQQKPTPVIAKPKQKPEKPRKIVAQKPTAKIFKVSKPKQVAALAAGKGSRGKKRSTDGKAAQQSYNSKVLARLRAAKTYPAAARGRGIEGTAILTFTISSSGRVTSARLSKGAGHPLLDAAVLAMARKAAPFPAFPTSITKNQMTFSVPVQFKIN